MDSMLENYHGRGRKKEFHSLWSQKCWAHLLPMSSPKSLNIHMPNWPNWPVDKLSPSLSQATTPNSLHRPSPRAVVPMPSAPRAHLGGEEMGHGVRGTASNPYPDSRQRLAITVLHSPRMQRGPREAARMWGPVTSQGPQFPPWTTGW